MWWPNIWPLGCPQWLPGVTCSSNSFKSFHLLFSRVLCLCVAWDHSPHTQLIGYLWVNPSYIFQSSASPLWEGNSSISTEKNNCLVCLNCQRLKDEITEAEAGVLSNQFLTSKIAWTEMKFRFSLLCPNVCGQHVLKIFSRSVQGHKHFPVLWSTGWI